VVGGSPFLLKLGFRFVTLVPCGITQKFLWHFPNGSRDGWGKMLVVRTGVRHFPKIPAAGCASPRLAATLLRCRVIRREGVIRREARVIRRGRAISTHPGEPIQHIGARPPASPGCYRIFGARPPASPGCYRIFGARPPASPGCRRLVHRLALGLVHRLVHRSVNAVGLSFASRLGAW